MAKAHYQKTEHSKLKYTITETGIDSNGNITLLWEGRQVSPLSFQSLTLGKSIPSLLQGWLIVKGIGKINQDSYPSS